MNDCTARRMMAACVVVAMVVCAHAGLIGHSRWQADEYQHFASLRQEGLGFALGRFLYWGSRPWSELLGTFYGLAVNLVHRPLAGACLAPLWAGLGLACVWPAWRWGGAATRLARVLLGLSVGALFLLVRPISEVFYWPSGGLAYLPTLAGAAWLFWCLADGRRGAAACALALAAGSSEVGLFLTVLFSGLVVVRPGGVGRAGLGWLVPGLAVAIPLVFLLLHGRVGHEKTHGALGIGALRRAAAGQTVSAAPILPKVAASLGGAVPEFLEEAAGFGGGAGRAPPVLFLLANLGGFLGARWSLRGSRGGDAGRYLPHLAVALVLAAFCTLAAAQYQFASLCCQRHETMRGCFFILAAICLGGASARWRVPSGSRPMLAAVSLVVPVLMLFAARLPALGAAYRDMGAVVRARAATWQSGLGAGDGMTLVLEPEGQLITSGEFLAPGIYRLDAASPWYVRGLCDFFNKQLVVVKNGEPAPARR